MSTSRLRMLDDLFTVTRSRFGTWNSYDRNGGPLITSLTEELCIEATKFYLQGKEVGWDSLSVSPVEPNTVL